MSSENGGDDQGVPFGEWSSVLKSTSSEIKKKERTARIADGASGFIALAIALTDLGFILGRGLEIYGNPDLNGDGRFSLFDIPPIVGSVFVAIGEYLQVNIASGAIQIGAFLEMDAAQPVLIWSILLSLAAYSAPLLVAHLGSQVSSRATAEAQAAREKLERSERRRTPGG